MRILYLVLLVLFLVSAPVLGQGPTEHMCNEHSFTDNEDPHDCDENNAQSICVNTLEGWSVCPPGGGQAQCAVGWGVRPCYGNEIAACELIHDISACKHCAVAWTLCGDLDEEDCIGNGLDGLSADGFEIECKNVAGGSVQKSCH